MKSENYLLADKMKYIFKRQQNKIFRSRIWSSFTILFNKGGIKEICSHAIYNISKFIESIRTQEINLQALPSY